MFTSHVEQVVVPVQQNPFCHVPEQLSKSEALNAGKKQDRTILPHFRKSSSTHSLVTSGCSIAVAPVAVRSLESDRSAGLTTFQSRTPLSSITRNMPISIRRRVERNPPHLDELPIPTSVVIPRGMNKIHHAQHTELQQQPMSLQLQTTTRHQIVRSSSLGPLTPPHEQELTPWLSSAVPDRIHASGHGRPQDSVSAAGMGQTTREQSRAALDAVPIEQSVGDHSMQDLGGCPWLLRALRTATESLDPHIPVSSTKIISQVLPPYASDQRITKTYEVLCDHLQQILPEPRYISITHILAISSGQVVEDFPKSPPVTPNVYRSDSYFGDQTVFTHAAQVPVHHEFRSPGAVLPVPTQRNIMLAEANLILLERYIPPTTPEELIDFFHADSYRSYLADRLPELAIETGSLLLVYPTRTGGQSFARKYVAPVLDPLLRELTILKGLNTNAAERLGRMRAVESMYEFDELKGKVQELCASMNARTSVRKSRSAYALAHSETTKILLDRNTWMTWFIEQEQQRLKQDLVDYHKDGGKLPEGEPGKSELTTGMLTREITETLRKSTAAAGNVGIEVGVFVIRRIQQSTAHQ